MYVGHTYLDIPTYLPTYLPTTYLPTYLPTNQPTYTYICTYDPPTYKVRFFILEPILISEKHKFSPSSYLPRP